MKFISWNVNGIRSCIQKGFFDYLDSAQADFFCLQESKITTADFEKIVTEHKLTWHPEVATLAPSNQRSKPLYAMLAPSEKAGYAGVAILTPHKPLDVTVGLGDKRFDNEGRVLFAHYDKFSLVNVYIPNGQRDLGRIPYKIEFSDLLLDRLQELRKKQKNILICGDMNVAHEEIDIKNPKTNQKNSGFTPEERAWFTKFLSHQYIDTFRAQHPEARDVYSWWSYRPGVREKNVGWRIDYFVATEECRSHIKNAGVHMDVRGSDHCPISLETDF